MRTTQFSNCCLSTLGKPAIILDKVSSSRSVKTRVIPKSMSCQAWNPIAEKKNKCTHARITEPSWRRSRVWMHGRRNVTADGKTKKCTRSDLLPEISHFTQRLSFTSPQPTRFHDGSAPPPREWSHWWYWRPFESPLETCPWLCWRRSCNQHQGGAWYRDS